ncbi:MAG TPA: hypothetical protein VHN78_04280, partial [Chloroflexota bacterium]|nr:hypothetical protein [Chloroflexota bacterium]
MAQLEPMEPVPLIFSCDTEDYETPASDDAELLWARMFARHGIRACFCVVGEEARALRDRGRRDVLQALAGHEIASHSDMHSAHPTPAEYLDTLSWSEGVQRFMAQEGRAVGDLCELLGQVPSAWFKPGNSWGAVVPYAAGLLGMPVFCDAPFEWAAGHPMWYAGGLLLKYHTSFDRYFRAPAGTRFEQMRADFEELLAARQAAAQESGTPPGAIVMFTHPCRTVTAAFPSNFTAGKETPREAWQPAPLRERAEVEALVRDFDSFLRWIVELRASGRIELTTYRELYAAHREPPAPWLPLEEVLGLARWLANSERDVEPRRVMRQWLSPAEQFGVLAWALARWSVTEALPAEVPVRRLLGPVELAARGAEEAEPGSGGQVSAGDALCAAAVASERCSTEHAVPFRVAVGTTALGPGRFLRLAARTLLTLAAGGGREGSVSVPGGGDATALAGREDFLRLRFRDTWSVFPPAFEGRRL